MPKVLLVDTNRAAVPIYSALCALGLDVWVVGGNPKDVLAKFARNYAALDYSNVDELKRFVEQEGFDYVVPGCTDLSYDVCAQINNGGFTGLDSLASTRAVNNKEEFRQMAKSAGIPVPRVLSADEALAAESVIVKPVDSFSGKGITIVTPPCADSLLSACNTAREASKLGRFTIEEFVSGQLYSYSAFVRHGKVAVDFVVQEDCKANRFAVDLSRMANGFSDEMRRSLRGDVERLVEKFSLVDGLVHAQFIVRDDAYWVIEMTRRCPGDLYSLLIQYSTGYPYAAAYASAFAGQELPSPEADFSQEFIIRHTVSAVEDEATLWGFSFSTAAELKLLVPLATAGDRLGQGPRGRAAILFLRAGSEAEQSRLYEKLASKSLFTSV